MIKNKRLQARPGGTKYYFISISPHGCNWYELALTREEALELALSILGDLIAIK